MVKFAEIIPAQVRLKGTVGTPLAVDVDILPHSDHPFTIIGVETEKDDQIRCQLLEQCGTGNTGRCTVRVENIKKTPGRYAEIVTIRTDNPARPSFPIFVVGIIR